MLITGQVEFMNKKKFIKIVLDKNSDIFIIYVAILKTKIRIISSQAV